MSFFNEASHFVIENGTFVNNVTSGGLHNLYQYTAHGAMHDSKDQYDAPKCHPDTRKQLLSDVHEWIKVPEKETGITFLHGPAGSGKSCIARSVCEEAAAKGLLGASFFFWRSAPDRNSMDKLFTTVAYQLAMANNDLAKHIITEVERDPRLVQDAPLEHQFRKLIFEPCLAIPLDKLHVTAIVIDGLDECIDQTMQVEILRLLAKAVRYEAFPLGFFITSRPELHIQEVFNTKEIIFAMQPISLDGIAGVSQDIRTVLQSGFSRILNKPRFKTVLRSVPRPWPSPDSIEKLVRRSSGQFIYPATVMKFISSPNHNPDSQLQIVLGIKDSDQSSPLADLDCLYHEILSRVQDIERTKKVLGYIIAMKYSGMGYKLLEKDIVKAVNYNQRRLLLVVEQLLGLPDGEAYFALNQLHSVLDLKVGSESFRLKSEIKFHHRSFQDFLTIKKRSTTFYVHQATIHLELAQSCLKIMSLPKYETVEHHAGWVYAFFRWDRHFATYFRKAYRTDLKLLEAFSVALKRYFFGFPRFSNPILLKQALELLGVLTPGKLKAVEAKAIRNLIYDGSLSQEENDGVIYLIVRDIQPLLESDVTMCNKFKRSILFPMIHKRLELYNNDPMLKQALPLCLILWFVGDYLILENADLPFGSILPKLTWYLDTFRHHNLETFLSNIQYSGQYHCTRDDYADAYIRLFSLRTWSDERFRVTYGWTTSLEYLKPTATPALMEKLISKALHFQSHFSDGDSLNEDKKSSVKRVLDWLKTLPCPPQDVIEAWEAVIKPKTHKGMTTQSSSSKTDI